MVMLPTIEFASLGMADSLILMVMALVVFGPRRLPEMGRRIGKLMYEFRKASNDFKFQMEEELRNADEADSQRKEEERQRLVAEVVSVREAAQLTTTAPAPPAEIPSLNPEQPPVIQPPSVGEQVPATRPGSVTTEVEVPAPPTPPDETTPATEQVHNG